MSVPASTEADLWLGYDDYYRLIERLCLKIHESGWKFDQILCLARGGMRVGDVISRIFDLPLAILSTSSYREDGGTSRGDLDIAKYITISRGTFGGKVLLADDLVDSGVTLEKVSDHLKRRFPEVTEVRSAVIWWKGSSTVQRMLDFYRPNVEFKPLQILDLLEHVLHLISQQLHERNIRVTTAWPAKLPNIMAISNQIEQVFINLALNAFDAMPQGGELCITIAQKKKMVEILFQDSGSGVPAEMRQTIFEPFVSSKISGTGLGLAVSYDIVTAHGGRLDLMEGNKTGACFRVMLPINHDLVEKKP